MANGRAWRYFKECRQQRAGEAAPVVRAEIASLAYDLYEERGRGDGHDWADWLKAEQIVRQRQRAVHRVA